MDCVCANCRLIACVSYFHPHRLDFWRSQTLGRHSPRQRPFISRAKTEMWYREMPRLSTFLYTAIFHIHSWIIFQHSLSRLAVAHYVHKNCVRVYYNCMTFTFIDAISVAIQTRGFSRFVNGTACHRCNVKEVFANPSRNTYTMTSLPGSQPSAWNANGVFPRDSVPARTQSTAGSDHRTT